jgi:hypothetical protein
VDVRREDIFDQSDSASFIARVANMLHIVTKPKVVNRELLIVEGQPYDSVTAAETARNLRKLGIFREVSVDSARSGDSLVEHVTTRDSWTTQPYVSFKSTGDQITWGVGIAEKNLLGYQTKVSLKYTQDPDRSTTQIEVNVPRAVQSRGVHGRDEPALGRPQLARDHLVAVPVAVVARVGHPRLEARRLGRAAILRGRGGSK